MKVHLEMTRQVGANARSAMFGTTLASIAVFLVLDDVVPNGLIYTWIAVQVILLAARFHFSNAFNRFETESEEWEKSVAHFKWAMFFIGLGWGMASVLIAYYGSLLEQVVVLAIILGIVGAAIGTVAQILTAYTVFLLGAMVPQIASFLAFPDEKTLMLGLLTIVYSMVVYRAGGVLAANIKDLVEVREHLSNAKKTADEANAAKSQFLSRMSHEFRTPLNAIIGFSQVQEWHFDDSTPQDLRQSREHILHAGKHLLTLVEDIFDIVKIEQDRIEIALEAMDLDATLQTSIGLVQNQAGDAEIQLIYKATDLKVIANSNRLTQVMVNLLSNAIKYNNTGGSVTVTVDTLPNAVAEIRVEDTGVGINPEEAEKLFAPFSRLTYATHNEIEGTGIGLTLSKFLIERMNGTIGLEHSRKQGSIFWVCLPLVNTP
ncbi:MAG: sensor histidine kinase [Halioglobus sp.]